MKWEDLQKEHQKQFEEYIKLNDAALQELNKKRQAMKWEHLEKEHQKQREEYNKLRDAAWQQLIENRDAMYAVFGDNEANIPATALERIEQDRQEWLKDWGKDGEKATALREIQKIEREELKDHTLLLFKNRLANSRDRDDDRER